jgi:pimeloyl-ACP methyl ester carboxylesterase
MSRKRWLRTLYAVALTASTAYRWSHSFAIPLKDKHVIEAGVRIAYFDSGPHSSKPVLLLIHGSPGSSDVVRGLADLVKDEYRVIAPDLPGFGASEHDLPDYSFRAHAGYVLQLLQQLGIDKVHAAGFSMGGGVVLSLASLAPEHVCSLEMISAIGVQEEELTGSYWGNHALHGLQLGLLWMLNLGAPHFGALDGEGLNVEYARNFYDSDQRPLRRILEHYRGPMLILHGEHDRNVPLSAAKEHHRLVPQSQMVVFDSNHFMIFQRPEMLTKPLKTFLGNSPRCIPSKAAEQPKTISASAKSSP